VSDDFASHVTGIAALAEPARRALYEFVVAEPDAVSREQAADGAGMPLHSARFHLDRLVDDGLLEVEFRRLSGRTGPGAGRPSKLYRRADRQVSVSLPERRYDLAGDVLAEGVDEAVREGVAVQDAVHAAAGRAGRRLAAEAGAEMAASWGAGARGAARLTELDRTAGVLAGYGYEPRIADEVMTLSNCPFDRLAKQHTELVCGLNLALVDGVVEGLGCTHLESSLDPQPDRCCVRTSGRR